MQVDTLPVTRRAKKHEFHTISTSKNIAKEKPLYLDREFSKEDFKNDIKSNLKSNNSSSKSKKMKNSLNSLLFATLLPTSIVYPNVLDYICNNNGANNNQLKKKNSKKNKKFWTAVRKKKVSELSLDDKIISSSILSPNYASPSPSTPKELDFKIEESKITDNNPPQPPDSKQTEPINKETNITPPSSNQTIEESTKPQENNKNIPKNENIPQDNILASKPPLISKNISKSNQSLNKSNISINKTHNLKNNNNSVLTESLPFLSTIGLEDNTNTNKNSLNIINLKKNLSSSVTNINTNVHSKEFNKGYKSYTNLSIDDERQSVMYNISPTLTHGELHKKIDTQNSTYAEQISNLKNTYIITRHNSIEARRDKENRKNSFIKRSSESITSSNKQISFSKSNRSSVGQISPNNNNVTNDSKSEKMNSFPDLDTIKNKNSNNLLNNNDNLDLTSEHSINTITITNFKKITNDSSNKEIEKINDIVAESTDQFFSMDSIDSNIEQSQYFEAISKNPDSVNNSINSLLLKNNNKKTKAIQESKLKNATNLYDDNTSLSSEENNEEMSVTPKNNSKSKLNDIPKSTFSSFEFDDDDNDFSGPLLTLPDENIANFSRNYLNNIKQNNYSSTLSIDCDDSFLAPSSEKKPTNLEKLQSLFTNDDSSIETKTGSNMKTNQSASLSKVANDYLNTMCDFETWDDDFDGDFSIPETVVSSQKVLKQEIISFKSFAVNIEDIKSIYNNILQLNEKLNKISNPSTSKSLKIIEEKYTNCIEKYEVLIDLAEQDENDDDDSKISTRLPFERYITVLEELLNDNTKETKNELDSEKIFCKDGNNINKNYIFGINMLPVLLNNIEPIRTQLKEYYIDLNNLLLNSK